MSNLITPSSTVARIRRMTGLLGYLLFVLIVVFGINQWQSKEEKTRDARRGVFIGRVCVALDDFRVATNSRNAPLYALVQQAEKASPTVDDNTGKPLTPAQQKAKAKTLEAFREAYKPIPPVTNCEDVP